MKPLAFVIHHGMASSHPIESPMGAEMQTNWGRDAVPLPLGGIREQGHEGKEAKRRADPYGQLYFCAALPMADLGPL